MTSDDEAFYQGNCHGKYKATCSSTVCKKLLRCASRVQKRFLYFEKIQSESTSSSQVCEEEAAKMLSDDDIAEEDDDSKDEDIRMEISLSPQPLHQILGRPLLDGRLQQILPNRL